MNKFDKVRKWAKKNGKQIVIVSGCAVLSGVMYVFGHNTGHKLGMRDGVCAMVLSCSADADGFCVLVDDIMNNVDLSHDDLVRSHEFGRECLKVLRKANC